MRVPLPSDGDIVKVLDLRGTCGRYGVIISPLASAPVDPETFTVSTDEQELRSAKLLPDNTYQPNSSDFFNNGLWLKKGNSDQDPIGTSVLHLPQFSDALFARRNLTNPNALLYLDVQIYDNGTCL